MYSANRVWVGLLVMASVVVATEVVLSVDRSGGGDVPHVSRDSPRTRRNDDSAPSAALRGSRGSIDVVRPSGSTVWHAGDTVTIEWNVDASQSTLRLELWRDYFLQPDVFVARIQDNWPARPMSLTWTVPWSLDEDDNYYVYLVGEDSETAESAEFQVRKKEFSASIMTEELLALGRTLLSFSRIAYCATESVRAWSCALCQSDFYASFTPVGVVFDVNSFIGDDMGFVACSLEYVVVAFRGSEDAGDWAFDLSVIFADYPEAGASQVHSGFLHVWEDLRDQIRAYLLEAVHQCPHRNDVYITGHSLGGAVAGLAAADMVIHPLEGYEESTFHLVTFGQPRPGSEAFAKWIDVALGGSYRFVNKGDPVPVVPGRSLYYHHYAQEVWFDGSAWRPCDLTGEDPGCIRSHYSWLRSGEELSINDPRMQEAVADHFSSEYAQSLGALFPDGGECVDLDCVRQCELKECGSDNCGGVCGECPTGQECTEAGLCVTPSHSKATRHTALAVGLSVGAGVLGVIGGVIFYHRRRRRKTLPVTHVELTE